MQRLILSAACGFLLVLAGCASDEPPERPHGMHAGAGHGPRDEGQRKAFHPPSETIMRYDANKDGTITLDEMKSVLRKEFAAADTNHDGVLDEAEARAVNEARWKELSSTSSPIIDFNQDGHIDFNEFAGAVIALFEQFDRNQDGVLEPEELHPQQRGRRDDNPPAIPSQPAPPPQQ